MARLLVAAVLMSGMAAAARGQGPYGLDSRAAIGPYLNNVLPPTAGAFEFPSTLSATGAFRDLGTLEPAEGLIPYTVNSPLWSDGAIKTRWMALPNDGPPYGPGEQINFAPVGEWTFPDGTVFVKQFDLTVNEATGERRRLETRLLVRNSDGRVYGITYKWRPDQTDADLLPDGLEEDIAITTSQGATRIQRYTYPSRGNCLFCHNQHANYVLGPKTHQLNGDYNYPATGRTDNQLRTFNHLGLLNPAPSETSFATYLRSVAVNNPTAPVQHRMRSWIDANCSHCHRPGGFGAGFDGRFDTPLENQNLLGQYVKFRDLAGSQLYQRDNALNEFKMPPIAKNVVHKTAMATLRQWIASPLEVLSIFLHGDPSHLAVRFNSRVNPATAAVAANYSLDREVVVSEAMMGSEPDTVILTVSPLVRNQNYTLTVSDVVDTAPSANTIWPKSRESFAARFPVEPTRPRLANLSTRAVVRGNDRALIGGFIAKGGPMKRVLLRGIGPSLAERGISGSLAEPVIELFDRNGVSIGFNDNWGENANRQEITDTGIAPSSPNESALLMTLPASAAGEAYTVVLRGGDSAEGVAVVELYDLDRTSGAELANISARALVGTGDHVIIGGFIVVGSTSRKLIVRALGPSLPVGEQLDDPALEIVDRNGTAIAENDNWRSHQEAAITSTAIPPPRDLEAAIITAFPPGAYTAIVRGTAGTTGVALVEIYGLE